MVLCSSSGLPHASCTTRMWSSRRTQPRASSSSSTPASDLNSGRATIRFASATSPSHSVRSYPSSSMYRASWRSSPSAPVGDGHSGGQPGSPICPARLSSALVRVGVLDGTSTWPAASGVGVSALASVIRAPFINPIATCCASWTAVSGSIRFTTGSGSCWADGVNTPVAGSIRPLICGLIGTPQRTPARLGVARRRRGTRRVSRPGWRYRRRTRIRGQPWQLQPLDSLLDRKRVAGATWPSRCAPQVLIEIGRVDPQLPADVDRGQLAAVDLPVDRLAGDGSEARHLGRGKQGTGVLWSRRLAHVQKDHPWVLRVRAAVALQSTPLSRRF